MALMMASWPFSTVQTHQAYATPEGKVGRGRALVGETTQHQKAAASATFLQRMMWVSERSDAARVYSSRPASHIFVGCCCHSLNWSEPGCW